MTRKYIPARTRTAKPGSVKGSSRRTKTTRGGGTAHGLVAAHKSSEKSTDAYNRHHRFPRGHDERNNKEHIVRVKKSQHQGFHLLFPDKTWHDPRLMEEILNTFIRPDYRVVIIKR